MIGKLTGRVDSVDKGSLILDVNGVGYVVHASNRLLSHVSPSRQESLSLLIETVVREDAFMLYGFENAQEKEWFNLLTGVQGVGAKAALAILSVADPDMLRTAVFAGDKAVFTRADGVGPKLGTRLCTELKDKVEKLELSIPKVETTIVSQSPDTTPAAKTAGSNQSEDAVSALVNLGYGRSEAYGAVHRALGGVANDELEDIIREALKDLAQ